jgi:DinB superfamily
MEFLPEIDAQAKILLGHFRSMARRLRLLPEDKWDWSYSPPAPTPRILAAHALAWMQSDRQHIENPDAKTHRPIPEPPSEPNELCKAMEEEADALETLLKSLTLKDLDQIAYHFGIPDAKMDVREFIAHMIQNLIYKHGQFTTIFFALGLDGTEPYKASFPNDYYDQTLGIR